MQIPWWAKHHAKYEIFEHRFCTDGKVVARCKHDGARYIVRQKGNHTHRKLLTGSCRYSGDAKRFPCSACEKNKKGMRWSDYKASEFRHRGIMKKEQQKIADIRWQSLQEEFEEFNRPVRNAMRAQAEFFKRLEENPNDPKLLALRKALEELNAVWPKFEVS